MNENQPAESKSIIEIIVYYINLLLSYKKFIILTVSVCSILIFVFLIVSIILPSDISPLPDIYQSNAVLLLQQNENADLESLLSSLGSISSDMSTGFDYGQLTLRILNSRIFLDRLVEDLDIINKYNITDKIKTNSRDLILSKITSEYNQQLNTLTIMFEDIDPEFSYNAVNRIVDLLQEWYSERGGTSRLNQKTLLEEKLQEVSENIASLETQIGEFQQKYGVLSVEDLAASQTELIDELRQQLVLKELEIKDYASITKVEDYNLIRLKEERDNIIETIDQIEQGYVSSGKFSPPKDELPELSLEFSHLTRDLRIQQQIYETLSENYEVVKLSLESYPVFQILEEPEIPEEKTGPQRFLILLISVIVIFITSIIFALVHSFLKKSFKISFDKKLKIKLKNNKNY